MTKEEVERLAKDSPQLYMGIITAYQHPAFARQVTEASKAATTPSEWKFIDISTEIIVEKYQPV